MARVFDPCAAGASGDRVALGFRPQTEIGLLRFRTASLAAFGLAALPRSRSLLSGALGVALCVTLFLGARSATAQTTMADVDPLSPEVMWSAKSQSSFSRSPNAISQNAKGKAGAVSGYDSSNGAAKLRARRRTLASPQGEFKPAIPTVSDQGRIDGRATALPPQAPVLATEWNQPVLETNSIPTIPAPAKRPTSSLGPYDPLGIRVGTFIVKPAVEISGGLDTNPGTTPKGSRSLFGVVAPELSIASDWKVHDLRAMLRGTFTDYQDQSSLNRPYFESRVDGRVDVSRQTQIDLQQRLVVSTEDPGSPNADLTVAKQPVYYNLGGSAGVTQRFNRLEVTGKVDIDRTEYEDSTLSDGTSASNADRNFNQFGGGLRGTYEFSPSFRPFVALDADTRIHDQAVDRFDQRRDSTGVTPRVGAFFELSRLITGSASVGYLTRNYADPGLTPLTGVVADASLIWTPTKITTVTLAAKSTADESTSQGISGILTREVSAQVDHDLRRWLTASVKAGYGFDSFFGAGCDCVITNAGREDQRYWAAFGLTYRMSREVQVKGEVRREGRTSNVPGNDYTANIFTLGVRLQR
jgi:hypothetical protein